MASWPRRGRSTRPGARAPRSPSLQEAPVSVVVVATITPRPDAVDAVREAILAAVPKVHAEPGCELYALHEGDGVFVMVERWESPDALRVHGKAEALSTLGAALADKLAAPLDVRRLSALPAGDPDKGAV
nr:putative quinol monooxygenase [Blastococcus saxobsidens]